MDKYVHYGCGLDAPKEWLNYDVSLTLRINNFPIIGRFTKAIHHTDFPSNVKYGNVVKGLPNISNGSCKGIFCSHVLEHLALDEFNKALRNSYDYLKKGGVFRCIVPDLEYYINQYHADIRSSGSENASGKFIRGTHLGYETLGNSFKQRVMTMFGRSKHKWMWDKYSLKQELIKVGFSEVRICEFGDSIDLLFNKVENRVRYVGAIAFECIK